MSGLRETRWAVWLAVAVLSAILLVALFALLLAWAPTWLADDSLTGKDHAEDVGRARTAMLAAVAGLIAVTGAIFTGLSYRLSQSGHVTDRFTRAIDQLGNPSRDVRLGGIYALERLADEWSAYRRQVLVVLGAYVREHAPWPPGEATPDDDSRIRPKTDVQAALTVLGRLRDRHKDRDFRVDVSETDLRGARLMGSAVLQRGNLFHAHLEHAWLREARLDGASLIGAHLDQAIMPGVNLEGAILTDVSFDGADLTGARWNSE